MSDRSLRRSLLRIASEEPDYADEIKAILAMNDGEDEDSEEEDMGDDHLAIKIRKKRRGPGANKKRRKDRLRKRKKRRSQSYRNRQKRLRKKRRNKPRKFRNKYADRERWRSVNTWSKNYPKYKRQGDTSMMAMALSSILLNAGKMLADDFGLREAADVIDASRALDRHKRNLP